MIEVPMKRRALRSGQLFLKKKTYILDTLKHAVGYLQKESIQIYEGDPMQRDKFSLEALVSFP